MRHFDAQVLSDCQLDCLELFRAAENLRGQPKEEIFQSPAFMRVKKKILERHPDASDRQILAFILRRTARILHAQT